MSKQLPSITDTNSNGLSEEELLAGHVQAIWPRDPYLEGYKRYEELIDVYLESLIDDDTELRRSSVDVPGPVWDAAKFIDRKDEVNGSRDMLVSTMVVYGHKVIMHKYRPELAVLRDEEMEAIAHDPEAADMVTQEQSRLRREPALRKGKPINFHYDRAMEKMIGRNAEAIGVTKGCYSRHCMYAAALSAQKPDANDEQFRMALESLGRRIRGPRFRQVVGYTWDEWTG